MIFITILHIITGTLIEKIAILHLHTFDLDFCTLNREKSALPLHLIGRIVGDWSLKSILLLIYSAKFLTVKTYSYRESTNQCYLTYTIGIKISLCFYKAFKNTPTH